MSAPTPSPAKITLDKLSAIHPVFKKQLPLAIGIKDELAKAHPDLSSKEIAAALRYFTGSTSYLKAVQGATHRFDLQGNPAEELTEEHRQYATTVLKERFKKKAQAHRDQAKAKEAVEAEKRKTEKLGKLLEKFGRA